MTGCCSMGKSFNSKVLESFYRVYSVVDAIAPLMLDLVTAKRATLLKPFDVAAAHHDVTGRPVLRHLVQPMRIPFVGRTPTLSHPVTP